MPKLEYAKKRKRALIEAVEQKRFHPFGGLLRSAEITPEKSKPLQVERALSSVGKWLENVKEV